jgi:hypothetical protein
MAASAGFTFEAGSLIGDPVSMVATLGLKNSKKLQLAFFLLCGYNSVASGG